MNTNEMKRTLTFNQNFISFGIPLALLGLLILLMRSSLMELSDTLHLAITIDLLLTVPFVYFLLIRKSEIPNTTVVPVMVIGLLLGTYFLPLEHQSYLNLFKTWALPLIEITVLTFVVIKVRKAIKTYKSLKGSSPDFFSVLKSTCYEILPKKAVLPFATEIAVFYYGFINWKKVVLHKNEFSYHQKSGSQALFGALLVIIVIETFAIHFLLARWSSIGAWILTALSAYTALQIFGIAKSLSQRPIAINQNSISLKYGILNEVEILFSDIAKIELSSKDLDTDKSVKKLSPLGELESHNIIIHLNQTNEMIGLYGFKKNFKVIALHVDEPIEFKKQIEIAKTSYYKAAKFNHDLVN